MQRRYEAAVRFGCYIPPMPSLSLPSRPRSPTLPEVADEEFSAVLHRAMDRPGLRVARSRTLRDYVAMLLAMTGAITAVPRRLRTLFKTRRSTFPENIP
jgi:hypothetical protein